MNERATPNAPPVKRVERRPDEHGDEPEPSPTPKDPDPDPPDPVDPP